MYNLLSGVFIKKFFSAILLLTSFLEPKVYTIKASANKVTSIDLNINVGSIPGKDVKLSGHESTKYAQKNKEPSRYSKGGLFKTLEKKNNIANRGVPAKSANKVMYNLFG